MEVIIMNKWDLYDNEFKKTDMVVRTNEKIEDGYYHLSTNTWVINDKKEVLLVRNALNYELYYPGFWGPISENVLSGEDGVMTVKKSLFDMLGIKITADKIKRIDCEKRDPFHYIYETYIINDNINIKDFKLDESRIINVKWVSYEEINNMISNGEVALVFQSRIEKHILPMIK